jgi:deoxyribodipyrimidine photolyase
MLKKIPINFLQKPWEYNDGSNYFKPIVDYKESRANALLKYSLIN